MKNRKYTLEEYNKVLRLYEEGYKIRPLSRLLGINRVTIRGWIRGGMPRYYSIKRKKSFERTQKLNRQKVTHCKNCGKFISKFKDNINHSCKNSMQDKNHSKGIRDKISRRTIEEMKKLSDEWRKKVSIKLSNLLNRLWQDPKYREKALKRLKEGNERFHHSEEFKEKRMETIKKMAQTKKELFRKHPELKKVFTNKHKWEDKEWREKIIKAMLKGLLKRPTSLERQMINIIKKHNLPYKYVGDGSFFVGHKNPDFININGEKICIEVANEFHHPDPYCEDRIEHFKKWGWKCFVFRTNKLDKGKILKDIIK